MSISNFKPGEKELYERRFQTFFRGIDEQTPRARSHITLSRPQKRLEWKLILREKTHTRANDNPKVL